MTLEEVSVSINVYADDAMATLDAVAEKLHKLGNMDINPKVDQQAIVDMGDAAKQVLKSTGSVLNDAVGKTIDKLEEGKQSAWGFGDILAQLAGNMKSILGKGLAGGAFSLLELVPNIIGAIIRANQAAVEAQRQREEAQKQSIYATAQAEQTQYQRLTALKKQYVELSQKTSLNYKDAEAMAAIRRELAESYGLEAASVEVLTAAVHAHGKSLYSAQNDATWERLNDANKAALKTFDSITRLNKAKEKFTETLFNSAYGDDAWTSLMELKAADVYDQLQVAMQELKASGIEPTFSEVFSKALENEKVQLTQSMDIFTDWLTAHFSQHMTELMNAGIVVPEDMMDGMLEGLLAGFDPTRFESWEELEGTMRGVMEAMRDSLMDEGFMDALGQLNEQLALAYAGMTPDADAVNDAWQKVFGEDSFLRAALSGFPEFAGESEAALVSLIAACVGLDGMTEGPENVTEYLTQTAREAAESAAQAADAFAGLGEAGAQMGDDFDAHYNEVSGVVEQIGALGRQRTAIQNLKKLSTELKGCEKGSDKYNKTLKKINDGLGDAGINAKDTGKNMSGLDKAIANAEKGMNSASGSISDALNGVIEWAGNAIYNLQSIRGTASVDTGGAIEALNALISMAQKAQSWLSFLGLGGGGEGKGRGGGGGGGGSKADPEEEARRAAEEAERRRKEAIQADYDVIDHKRHLNQISFEEELRMLEELRRKHQLNAEEMMEWEERVYDLKQEIRERDSESIDNLGDGVIEALEARYEAMRDAELERLEKSREAWEKWRDDSVKAIEDQLDALDKLADSEDREKKNQEELRKIAKLRQQIAFERDDYNRAKLERQLEQAMESREDRLRKLELQDQKNALREQIEKIGQKADEEISALDKEEEALDKAYEERLQTAALRAEAEKLLLTQSQNDILQLLRDYAPEYDATGETLGEKLLEGFQRKVGGVAAWFEAFNAQIMAAQEQMAALAQAAADDFYQEHALRDGAQATQPPAVVNQTVNINQPVESPSQMARRMAEVNEELALLL